MSVVVNVIGDKEYTEEYLCSIELKKIFDESIPRTVIGEISIFSNITLFGQEVKDIDILVVGSLSNCPIRISINSGIKKEVVSVESFVTAIELKTHDSSGIFRKGVDLYVNYGIKSHNVTEQSNKQKYSLKNYFEKAIGRSPYITNLIWLRNVNQNQLSNLFNENKEKITTNIFSGVDFSFQSFIQLIAYQNCVSFYNGFYHINNNNSLSNSDYRNVVSLFNKVKHLSGQLTRQRVEQITSNSITKIESDSLLIFRGRSGCGKTVTLLQKAITLSEEDDARVLILTYNKALVSDIRRLFAFAEIPDFFNEKSIHVTTMQSYFYNLINETIYNGSLDAEMFLKNYGDYIDELLSLIDDRDVLNEYLDICNSNSKLCWDYVLIDEAQDWSKSECVVISHLFADNRIIVADGGQQFVRNINVFDWNSLGSHKNVKLKRCLRQKRNLVVFCDALCKKIYPNYIYTEYTKEMLGGRIIITNLQSFFEVYKAEYDKCIENGNSAYDVLCLVTHDLVDGNEEKKFKYRAQFVKNNISYWNGIDDKERSSYPIKPDEIRLLQYESCRGLEAWMTICFDLDVFLENKESTFVPRESDSLALESENDQKRKNIVNWLSMPLTRSIDTTIIVLRDHESKFSKNILDVAHDHGDYVTVIL